MKIEPERGRASPARNLKFCYDSSMFGNRNKRLPPFGSIHANDDQDIEVYRPRDVARRHLWSEGRLLLRDLIFALMVAVLAVVFIIQPVKVEGTSMLPHLHDGERIFVNKLIYYDEFRWMPRISRGDIVVFWYPEDPSKSYIKRVIGLPGDYVEMYEGRVRVNGQELDETYLDSQLNAGRGARLAPVRVKANYYFVLGDNRDNSSDSRSWGLVPKKYIYGKALFRYWPLTAMSIISHDAHYATIPSPSSFRPAFDPTPAAENEP